MPRTYRDPTLHTPVIDTIESVMAYPRVPACPPIDTARYSRKPSTAPTDGQPSARGGGARPATTQGLGPEEMRPSAPVVPREEGSSGRRRKKGRRRGSGVGRQKLSKEEILALDTLLEATLGTQDHIGMMDHAKTLARHSALAATINPRAPTPAPPIFVPHHGLEQGRRGGAREEGGIQQDGLRGPVQSGSGADGGRDHEERGDPEEESKDGGHAQQGDGPKP